MFALIDNISIIFTRHFAHTRVIYLPSLPGRRRLSQNSNTIFVVFFWLRDFLHKNEDHGVFVFLNKTLIPLWSKYWVKDSSQKVELVVLVQSANTIFVDFLTYGFDFLKGRPRCRRFWLKILRKFSFDIRVRDLTRKNDDFPKLSLFFWVKTLKTLFSILWL